MLHLHITHPEAYRLVCIGCWRLYEMGAELTDEELNRAIQGYLFLMEGKS